MFVLWKTGTFICCFLACYNRQTVLQRKLKIPRPLIRDRCSTGNAHLTCPCCAAINSMSEQRCASTAETK